MCVDCHSYSFPKSWLLKYLKQGSSMINSAFKKDHFSGDNKASQEANLSLYR